MYTVLSSKYVCTLYLAQSALHKKVCMYTVLSSKYVCTLYLAQSALHKKVYMYVHCTELKAFYTKKYVCTL